MFGKKECGIWVIRETAVASLLRHHSINAEGTGATRRNVKKQEAVSHCELAFVPYRPDPLGTMRHEIRDGHLSRGKQCCGRGEQSKRHQHSAAEFDQTCHNHQAKLVAEHLS